MNSLGRTPGAAPIRLRPLALMSAVVSALAVTVCVTLVGLPGSAASAASAAAASRATLSGTAVSGSAPLPGFTVALYRTSSDPAPGGTPTVLARSVTGAGGAFTLRYRNDLPTGTVAYVLVRRGHTVRLAIALGTAPLPARIVVNERTTVATGFALAQFIAGDRIAGRAPGVQNAAAMVRDLVDIRTGGLSTVVTTRPNGSQTSTMRAFDSLANLDTNCARVRLGCAALFRLAQAPGDAKPSGALAALADIARNPWHNVEALYALTRVGPAPYQPALRPSQRPAAWTLALRFAGDGRTMNGPGNMAIDADGNVWSTDNYTFSRNPSAPVCGGKLLLEFSPTGRYVRGSPFSGGGVDGAGYGITLDPHNHVWVGNFGFSAAKCQNPPAHNSVSEFSLAGDPLSPSATGTSTGGFTQGGVSWPQGTVSDRQGNIWIANCGNNTVTRYAGGDPNASLSIHLAISKPFDIALNSRGQAFVTGDASNAVEVLNPDGSPALPAPITGGGLDKPMGIAADIQGNMWVANSGFADVPCPSAEPPQPHHPASITLISARGTGPRATEFTGGGLTNPWGIAVDGHDNVWVTNFGGQRLSEFCGRETANCPPGDRTGQPISPGTGYAFNGLVRNTGVQVDPSGNVWVANNWKTFPFPERNAGGYQMVVFIGLAGPLRTPLIGPPNPL